ncbi:hypothetical protein RQP53_12300 [Paucibacter sp. APW11]|uniref:Uncharacterized protein n=1 Tax=Roseateles aquae TaxID=3077235 RepID=A0ABU3PC06_9BURK|nr:hypothetical protein [Paucibacter sp. APW11]MDT9000048.1 hypothetical protein [Paucibacter sp. APW11]
MSPIAHIAGDSLIELTEVNEIKHLAFNKENPKLQRSIATRRFRDARFWG